MRLASAGWRTPTSSRKGCRYPPMRPRSGPWRTMRMRSDITQRPEDELGIAEEIAPPLVRLLEHDLHPLDAEAAHPARGATQPPRPVVEEAADPDTHGDAQQR